MYKDCLCSLKYNQPVQTWHACLISCYVSIFSKQTSSKRCIQVMLSSCPQSVSMATVYLLFLAFYPQVTSLPGHNKASGLFPFVSERLLFRSESRKLQVRKQWGIQSRFLQAELSLVCVFSLSLLCNVHTTNMLTYITEEPIYEYFWLKSITHNWQCLRFIWSFHSCNRTKPQEKSDSTNICQGLFFTKHPLPGFIYQLHHLTWRYTTLLYEGYKKAPKWPVVSLFLLFSQIFCQFSYEGPKMKWFSWLKSSCEKMWLWFILYVL